MNLFLKHQQVRPEVADALSPYLAARREWDERYGDLITRAKNWRTMAALCALVALVATAGMVWLSARSHVVPFVVLVDNLGRTVASGVADQTSLNDDRLKRSNIFMAFKDKATPASSLSSLASAASASAKTFPAALSSGSARGIVSLPGMAYASRKKTRLLPSGAKTPTLDSAAYSLISQPCGYAKDRPDG